MAPLPADGVIDQKEEEGAEGEEDEDEPEPELDGLEPAAPLVTAVRAAALPESRVRAIARVEADEVGLELGVRGTSGEEIGIMLQKHTFFDWPFTCKWQQVPNNHNDK